MKKQHLLLIFLLAFFTGISSGYAQCVPGPLSPAPGVEYDYLAAISGPGYNGNNVSMYDWYVTQDVNLLTGLVLVPPTMFTVNGSTPYHLPATGVNHILITWTPAAITAGLPFYLVLRYRENNSTASPLCSTENIRVWNIVPVNTFLLAIEGGMFSGGIYVPTAGSFTCAADVTGAIVTPGPSPTALLTYGNNTLNFVATASGILGNWRPDISVPALQTSQVYVSAQWTADMTGAGGWVSFGIAGTGAAQSLQSPSDATVTNVAGTPILIRIVFNNMNWQTLADQPINVGLDGYLPTAYTVSDIQGSGATPCLPEPAFGRNATFTVKARSTITGNPATIPLTNP